MNKPIKAGKGIALFLALGAGFIVCVTGFVVGGQYLALLYPDYSGAIAAAEAVVFVALFLAAFFVFDTLHQFVDWKDPSDLVKWLDS